MSHRPGRSGYAEMRRDLRLAALGATVPLGLLWRLAPLHLPPFAFKYGGSALWAVAVYWLCAVMAPSLSPARCGGVAAVIATLVELGKRVYWPPLDHFRETLAGKLLLGRYFSYGALVAYGLAILVAICVDRWLFTHRAHRLRVSDGGGRPASLPWTRHGSPTGASGRNAEESR